MPTTVRGLPIVITSLNLTGSLLSFLGTLFIIVTYVILSKRRHFRHVLILNLAVADCMNALNLSISGIYILVKRMGLSEGEACLANGFIAQFSVQATDCAILAIAITTVCTITQFKLQTPFVIWSAKKAILVTAAVWFLPTITAFIALGRGWYGPATGSWCWVVQFPIYLRYALTHGWRILFIVIEIALYTYLHIFLRRHYRNMNKIIEGRRHQTTWTSLWKKSKPIDELKQSQSQPALHIFSHPPSIPTPSPSTLPSSSPSPSLSFSPSAPSPFIPSRFPPSYASPPFVSSPQITPSDPDPDRQSPFASPSNSHPSTENDPQRSIQRILLLNAYPLAYIILWIPGLVNRFIELTGRTSRVTQVMQASTQFVGLANALTYGWNESIRRQLRRRICGVDGGRGRGVGGRDDGGAGAGVGEGEDREKDVL